MGVVVVSLSLRWRRIHLASGVEVNVLKGRESVMCPRLKSNTEISSLSA